MPYFLSDKNLSLGGEVELSDAEARHILLSHRVKVGEKIKIQGSDGKRFLSEVVSVTKKNLTVKPTEALKVPDEPRVKITLFQSVVSEKALGFIFQKGTELGVSEIVLFNSKNTATKLSQDLFKKKFDRWNKILMEAAKQSERAIWPKLTFAKDLDAAIALMKHNKIFLADVSGVNPTTLQPLHPTTLAIIIGPEGGFTPEELSRLQSLPNIQLISLGPILLRADTAALALVVICQNI